MQIYVELEKKVKINDEWNLEFIHIKIKNWKYMAAKRLQLSTICLVYNCIFKVLITQSSGCFIKDQQCE